MIFFNILPEGAIRFRWHDFAKSAAGARPAGDRRRQDRKRRSPLQRANITFCILQATNSLQKRLNRPEFVKRDRYIIQKLSVPYDA
jgi:hypothetical protein